MRFSRFLDLFFCPLYVPTLRPFLGGSTTERKGKARERRKKKKPAPAAPCRTLLYLRDSKRARKKDPSSPFHLIFLTLFSSGMIFIRSSYPWPFFTIYIYIYIYAGIHVSFDLLSNLIFLYVVYRYSFFALFALFFIFYQRILRYKQINQGNNKNRSK